MARISLPARARSAQEARERLTALLGAGSWGNESTRDSATLLLSEVVTNAIRYAAGGTILVTITLSRDALLAEVHDESASLPVRRPSGERGGWGLELLDLLSDRWGVREEPGSGKTVWFEMGDGLRR